MGQPARCTISGFAVYLLVHYHAIYLSIGSCEERPNSLSWVVHKLMFLKKKINYRIRLLRTCSCASQDAYVCINSLIVGGPTRDSMKIKTSLPKFSGQSQGRFFDRNNARNGNAARPCAGLLNVVVPTALKAANRRRGPD